MEAKWKKIFALHAETEGFKQRLSWSRRYVQQILRQVQKPYISFSGGKDSICMAHLVLQEDPGILLYHHDQGKHMPDPLRCEVVAIMNTLGKNIEIRPFSENLWGSIIPDFHRRGFDAAFIGLRMEESVSRRERIRAGRSLSVIPEYWPIQQWTWMDVWAYIVSNGLPYPSAYDVYAPVVGWDQVRFHSFFDRRLERFGNENLDGVLMWRYRHKK